MLQLLRRVLLLSWLISGLMACGEGSQNMSPIADSGSNRQVTSGESVTLNGGSSSDSDGNIVSYRWVSEESGVSLSRANTARPTFIAPTVSDSKTYSFKLTVTDNDGAMDSDIMVVTVVARNEAPTAKAKADKTTITLGETITLDATSSTDPNQDRLRYVWSVISSAEGSAALLSSTSSATPTFVPDVVGSYTVDLTVSDGLLSNAMTLSLTVVAVSRVAKPEMVAIPAGNFQMGDLSGDGDNNEEPVHSVSIAAFEIGKYEVTFANYDRYLKSRGIDISNIASGEGYDDGWGRGNRPIINVSWNDIQGYLDWLNSQLGIAVDDPKRYRLPTEAEWEYAARAGTNTKYPWGNEKGTNKANCFFFCGDSYDNTTTPVGSFSANPFGLHDMHGNAGEWIEDCDHHNYTGAPTDGSAWLDVPNASSTDGECTTGIRALRDVSLFGEHGDLRSASRSGLTAFSRDWLNGFRLARTF